MTRLSSTLVAAVILFGAGANLAAQEQSTPASTSIAKPKTKSMGRPTDYYPH